MTQNAGGSCWMEHVRPRRKEEEKSPGASLFDSLKSNMPECSNLLMICILRYQFNSNIRVVVNKNTSLNKCYHKLSWNFCYYTENRVFFLRSTLVVSQIPHSCFQYFNAVHSLRGALMLTRVASSQITHCRSAITGSDDVFLFCFFNRDLYFIFCYFFNTWQRH